MATPALARTICKSRIAIIGAGTAGLAAATLLARQGHAVTVFERALSLGFVGAGLLLQPSGLTVLDELGAREAIERYGHRVDALMGWTRQGRCIMRTEYRHLSPALHGVGIHRASLCHVLDEALQAVDHRRIFGCSVERLEESPREVRVHFFRDGEAHSESFDAVLVANGSASTLRPPELVRYNRPYPWGAMWTIRPLDESLSVFAKPHLQQMYDGAHRMAGVLPTGCTPQAPGQPMVSLFWSLPVRDMPAWQQPDFDFGQWRRDASAHWPALSPLLERLSGPGDLLPATYRDVVLSTWGRGRIGVIGDAAHAMSPQLGQGANMALLDASALARAVAGSDDWPTVWQRFHAERAGSIRFHQAMSWLLTPLFQSHIPGIALLRDIALPLSYHVPWLRRQNAATVAGMKRGWLDTGSG